jgi:hypothetical protein
MPVCKGDTGSGLQVTFERDGSSLLWALMVKPTFA